MQNAFTDAPTPSFTKLSGSGLAVALMLSFGELINVTALKATLTLRMSVLYP